MIKYTIPIVLMSLLGYVGPSPSARATDPSTRWWWPLNQRCPSCADDYCPKKLPCVSCRSLGAGPDDYCAKKLPCVRSVTCFDVDDYCAKPLPKVTPCYPTWYTGQVPKTGEGSATGCCSCSGPYNGPQPCPPTLLMRDNDR